MPERPSEPLCSVRITKHFSGHNLSSKYLVYFSFKSMIFYMCFLCVQFYMKTGNCKFGASCKYHHPKDIQVSLNGQTENGVQTQSMDDLGSDGDENAVKPLTSNPPSSYNTKGLPIRSVSSS